MAQSNGAFLSALSSRGAAGGPASAAGVRAAGAANRLHSMAAQQGNIQAHLKIGDAHFYGEGGLNVSYERAAGHYRTASTLRDPQARRGWARAGEGGRGPPRVRVCARAGVCACSRQRPRPLTTPSHHAL